MAANVNLDALLSREDFEVLTSNDDAPVPQTISARDLEMNAFFYLALRKPDFQRETSEWDARRVVGLIRTFIDGHLIPAVILWKHKEYLFVIDGSHRLSALIAWVHDDYGDGELSQRFFGHAIPQEQRDYAIRTRELVNREIGSYSDFIKAAQNPTSYGPDIVAKSRALGSRVLSLQWVRGDATTAEASFIRINQQAAQITPQELSLIRGRKKPDVMAARAITRRGTGHQYWSAFGIQEQQDIRKLASEIYSLLFEPTLSYPIKSLDIPACGSVYSAPALKMIHDFVLLCQGTVEDVEDTTGHRTVEFLRRSKRVAELIISNAPNSIGLHPAVYFYSWTGKQQPILFLTMARIAIEFERSKRLPVFIRQRGELEDFLIENRTLLNQIVRKFGTKDSGKAHLMQFYNHVLSAIAEGLNREGIIESIMKEKVFSYLQPAEDPYEAGSSSRFSSQVKSGIVIKELLDGSSRCPICRGLVPRQAISIDHIDRREDGGSGTSANAQITHPYCNTGIKEAAHAKARELVERTDDLFAGAKVRQRSRPSSTDQRETK